MMYALARIGRISRKRTLVLNQLITRQITSESITRKKAE